MMIKIKGQTEDSYRRCLRGSNGIPKSVVQKGSSTAGKWRFIFVKCLTVWWVGWSRRSRILQSQKYIRSARNFRDSWSKWLYPLINASKVRVSGETLRSFIKSPITFSAMSIRFICRAQPEINELYVTTSGRIRLCLFICLNKSIAWSMFFNSIQPCMSVL